MKRESFGWAFGNGGFRRTVSALRRLRASADDAESFAAQAWCQAWERRAQLRDETRLVPWVIASARNKFRDAQRRRRFTVPFPDGLEPKIDPNVNASVIDTLRILQKLAPSQSSLLKAVYLDDRTVDQVAAELRVSHDALLHRLSRARKAARRAFERAA